MNNECFVYREIFTADELKQMFMLRYELFRESRTKVLVNENSHNIDIDCYDLRSRHFGLFYFKNNVEHPIGYNRIVHDGYGPAWYTILQLAENFPEIYSQVHADPLAQLPVMALYPEPAILFDLYRKYKAEGKCLVEGSRLSIVKSYAKIKLVEFIASCGTAITFYVNEIDMALLNVFWIHQRIYRPFGFHQLDKSSIYETHGLKSVCLAITEGSIPENQKSRIISMAKAFQQSGCICYYPDRPDYFLPPYSS